MLKLNTQLFRNLAVLLLVFAAATPSSELLPGYTPLTARMMVYAIGIDSAEENVRITLAANSIDTAAQADIVSAEGKTFYAALTEAEKAASKEIFLGHTSIMIVGQQAAKESLAGFIDYTARNFRMRMNIKMLTVMGGTAKEILDLPGEGNSNILSKLESLTNTVSPDNNAQITLKHVVECMASEYLDPVTIAVKTIKNEDNGAPELSLAGFAVYKDASLDSFITNDVADAYGLVDGGFRISSQTVETDENESVSVEIVATENKIEFRDNGGLPEALITVDISCGIAEQFDKDKRTEMLNGDVAEKCRVKLAEKLSNDAQKLISYTKEAGIDIFGLVEKYSKYHPYRMDKISLSPEDFYKNMRVSVAVEPIVTNSYVLQKK